MFTKKTLFASLIPVLLTGLLVISCEQLTNDDDEPINAGAPAITVQPKSGEWNIEEDGVFILTVTANSTDDGELSYQWYKNTTNSAAGGTTIGEDDDTLTLNKEDYDADDTLYFYVAVTNTIANNGDGGKKTATATSAVATVTITSALVNARHPSITGQPQSGTWDVTEEDEFTLMVTATSPDNGTLSYQWYKGTSASAVGGTPIGEDDATLTLEKAHYPGDGHLYFYVVVTNTISDNGDGGTKTATVTSAVATVTVTGNGVEMVNAETPNITGQPQGGTWNVANDASHTLTVTATITDGGTLSYKWHKNTTHSATGGEEVGTNSATLTLEKTHYTGDGALYFYVVVTNTIDDNDDGGVKTATATSTVATVTVSGNGITQESEDIAITLVDPDALSEDITLTPVANASQVTFTVSENYHDYQWYLDGDKLDETSASLTLYKSVAGTDPRHVIVIAFDAGNTPYSGAVLFQFN